MGKHALLSPSGASRWLACTPSARLEETYPSTSNTAADEGTLAHSLSELMIRNHFKIINHITYQRELKKIKAHQLYNAEMQDHCTDYMTFILEKHGELSDPTIFIEELIDLQEFVPEGFGTVDCVMIADNILDINDLKYGKGVLVQAENNKQMMLYALGALKKYSLLYHIDKVRMTIFQPRLNNYSSFEVDAQWLLEWGETFVKPQSNKAFEGKGEYTPGEHCRFCKARNSCKALANFNMDLAKYVFEDPNKLTDEDISNILEKAPDFLVWLGNIKDYALQEAVVNGKSWPRFKLVQGRSNRKYTDEEAIQKALKKAKLDESLYMTKPSLIGITALEKNIGKAEVEKFVGPFIIKPPGAATLVPEWDKRPAISSAEAAKEAFENIDS